MEEQKRPNIQIFKFKESTFSFEKFLSRLVKSISTLNFITPLCFRN